MAVKNLLVPPNPIPKDLQEIYSQRYFHGVTSGYPTSGYQTEFPDWELWMDTICNFQSKGTFLDIGCAYGFLVNQARKRGFKAFGMDISRYALENTTQPYFVQGNAMELPFSDHTCDVITIFDVLEHLGDPQACVRELVRVLKGNGIIFGSTPDPIYFQNLEETHCYERPPSFWISLLESFGLKVVFRFSNVAYNFQFVASPARSRSAKRIEKFKHDFIGNASDCISTSNNTLTALPRTGWEFLQNHSRKIKDSSASIYLLNKGSNPLKVGLRFRLKTGGQSSTLRIRLDSYVIQEIYLTSEKPEFEIALDEIPLPEGGHHIFFELSPGGVEAAFSEITLDGEDIGADDLVEALPFDLYQRYRITDEIAGILKPTSLLDIGGYIGDQSGHLAETADFFSRIPDLDCFSTDLRQCDIPNHAPANAWDQPFEDGHFDLVISLDVLEHLPAERRPAFLAECLRVARNYVLVAAPFDSPDVRTAESGLRSGVMKGHGFLEEHEEMGLPSEKLITAFARSNRCEMIRLASSYIPRWVEMQILTQHFFSLHDSAAIRDFNRLYNQYFYHEDQRDPGYRSVFLLSKKPFTPDQRKELSALNRKPYPGPNERSKWILDPTFQDVFLRVKDLLEEKSIALTDSQFLTNSRQRLVEILEDEKRTLVDENRTLVYEKNSFLSEQKQLLAERKLFLEDKERILEDRSNLKADRDALRLSRDQLAEERDSLVQVQESLLKERDLIHEEAKNLRTDRDQFRSENQVLRKELQAFSEERNRLTEDRDSYRGENLALRQENVLLRSDRDALSRERENLARAIESQSHLREKVSALESDLTLIRSNFETTQAERDHLISERDLFFEDRNRIEEDRIRLRDDRDALRKEADRLTTRLNHTPIYKIALQRWFKKPEEALEIETEPKRVTAYIINYNGRKFLDELITSLRNQTYSDFEVRLIDNGSTDDSVEYVDRTYPEVKILAMDENLGFARAGNLGIRSCVSPYVVFLNADLKLEPNWLEELVKSADSDPSVAAVAPKMLLYDQPNLINGVGGAMNYLGYTWDRGMLEEDQGQYDVPAEVIFAPAAAALFRRDAFIHVGLFDERYFMYHEDVDLGWRLWLAGYRIITAPQAVVYHHFGGSTKESKGMIWRELIGERNNIRALLKNYRFGRSLKAVKDLALLPQPGRRKLGQIKNLVWNLIYYPETYMYRRRIQRKRVLSDSDLERLIVQSKDVLVRI